MGQSEVIQALKNLGGSALLQDLKEEYLKLYYPPEHYGEDYIDTFTKYRKCSTYKIIGKHIVSLKKTHTIKVDKVLKSKEEFTKQKEKQYDNNNNPRSGGYRVTRKKIIVTLLE